MIGGALLGFVFLAALGAPWLATHDPTAQDLAASLVPPAWDSGGNRNNLLGTDLLGRDIYSRLLYGARVSITTALMASVGAAIAGVLLGLIAGFHGGALDAIISRLLEIQLALPTILLALALVALLGPSQRNLVIVLGITGWMIYARVVRASVLSVREREFVDAARALGMDDARILVGHVLPNVLTPVLVVFSSEFARMILLESGLSYLGLGVPPPAAAWGRMLSESRSYMAAAYWAITFPGVAIMITVLGINMLGDGLRDVLDPKLHR